MKFNPSLRMSIEMTEEEFVMVENTDAKPRLIELYNEEDWKKVLEDEMLNPMPDNNAPQFRCTYMPNVKYEGSEGKTMIGFVFTFSHAVIDGMSTMSTLRKFRVFLNSVMKGEDLEIDSYQMMHPPVEHFQQRAFEALAEEEGRLMLLKYRNKCQGGQSMIFI